MNRPYNAVFNAVPREDSMTKRQPATLRSHLCQLGDLVAGVWALISPPLIDLMKWLGRRAQIVVGIILLGGGFVLVTIAYNSDPMTRQMTIIGFIGIAIGLIGILMLTVPTVNFRFHETEEGTDHHHPTFEGYLTEPHELPR
jgi:hypothetical protein